MESFLPIILGALVFLIVFKIVKKVAKALLFAVLVASVYYCITHPDTVTNVLQLISK